MFFSQLNIVTGIPAFIQQTHFFTFCQYCIFVVLQRRSKSVGSLLTTATTTTCIEEEEEDEDEEGEDIGDTYDDLPCRSRQRSNTAPAACLLLRCDSLSSLRPVLRGELLCGIYSFLVGRALQKSTGRFG